MTQWVRPAKELNMTGVMMNINSQLETDIDAVITSIINKYEGAA